MEIALFNALHDLAGQSKFLDLLGIFLADYLGYFLIVALVILLFFEKNWRERFYNFSLLILSFLLSWGLITEIIHFIYNRPRPFLALNFSPLINHAASPSFPSGHAAAFFAIAFAVYFINKRWSIWFLVAAVIMGLARIFVGVHWPLDIIGGAVAGFISVFVVKIMLPFKNFDQRSETASEKDRRDS